MPGGTRAPRAAGGYPDPAAEAVQVSQLLAFGQDWLVFLEFIPWSAAECFSNKKAVR